MPLICMPFGVRTDEALLQLVARVERTCWQFGFIMRDTLRGLLNIKCVLRHGLDAIKFRRWRAQLNTHLVGRGIELVNGVLSVLVAMERVGRRAGTSLPKCIIEAGELRR